MPAMAPETDPRILADVGGSGIKGSVIDAGGRFLARRLRVPTPVGRHPDASVAAIAAMAARLPAFDRIAVGFTGVVRDGHVRTAPLLDHDAWHGFPLAAALERALGRPCRLGNDADVHGFAVIAGRG